MVGRAPECTRLHPGACGTLPGVRSAHPFFCSAARISPRRLARIVYQLPLIVAALPLAIWIYLLAARGGFGRRREERVPAAKASDPSVIAVIPARNEEGSVALAVKSL